MTLRHVFIYLALATFLIAKGAEAGPNITFSSKSLDLGKIYYGLKKKAEFDFTNTGDETLIIKRLRSSCGCTQVVKGKQEILPGDSSKIVATLDTRGLKPGNRKKSIYVHSNDPKKPILKLLVRANIVRRVKIVPKSLTLLLHRFQENVQFEMKISNETEKAITVQGIEVSGSAVEAYFKPEEVVVQPDASIPFIIGLKLSKKHTWPIHSGRVKLKISDPVEKQVDLRYFIEIKKTKQKS